LSMWRNKGILALLLAVLCLAGCSAKQNETDFPVVPNAQTTKYELATVTEGTFCKTVKNTGNPVFAKLESVICEYEDAILKEELPPMLMSQVKAGDVIATLVQETSDTELARLELEYERTVENKENGISRHYAQIAAISGNSSIAYMQRVKAENDLALFKQSAEKACQTAKEALEEYRQRYEEKQITAPIDGKIYWTKTLRAGDSIAQGETFIQIYDPSAFYVKVSNPSDAFLRMTAPGTPVTISFLNRSYAGTVATTPNGLREADGRSVYITSDEIGDWPEVSSMSVECTLLELENMLMVDKDAIRSDDTANYVMVLEDGAALKQYVICGPEDGEVVCILDGLQAGQQVVLN